MADYTKYTKQEMQAYAIAKSIKENQIVIVGTGLPLIGASLAKRAVCPSCHPIVESGLMDCSPVEVPRSVGDNRFMAHCAVQWPNVRFVGFEANEWLHDEDRLIAFIGGAQIDPYGNCLLYTSAWARSYPFTAMITRSEGPSLSSGVTMGKR